MPTAGKYTREELHILACEAQDRGLPIDEFLGITAAEATVPTPETPAPASTVNLGRVAMRMSTELQFVS